MSWKERNPMELRKEFVLARLAGGVFDGVAVRGVRGEPEDGLQVACGGMTRKGREVWRTGRELRGGGRTRCVRSR